MIDVTGQGYSTIAISFRSFFSPCLGLAFGLSFISVLFSLTSATQTSFLSFFWTLISRISMAVVFEGFSIREYAYKMRSIDVVKCWPFTGAAAAASSSDGDGGNSEINKQTMESLLPPITVTKFRWWSDEIDLLKSTELANSGMYANKVEETRPTDQSDLLHFNLHVGEKSDERLDMLECPVCGAFAASIVNALNAHVDSCLAQASRQERRQMRMAIKATKSRIPKKRSITEIFAAAPQIHKVDTTDHENFLDEDENGSFDNQLNCKIERPKKKKKKNKVAVGKKFMKKNRKLKKKKNNKQDGRIAHKENGGKRKLQTPVNFNRKPNNMLCNRGSSTVSILRKKQSLKCSSAKKKSKIVQASKLIIELEKPSLPVRGILKNPTKIIPGHNAAMCKRATTQASTCGVQHSVRHVSFSGMDDILSPHKQNVTSFEINICNNDLDSFELSKEGNQSEDHKEFLAREINRNYDKDVSFSRENGIGVQARMEKQQLPDIHHNFDTQKFPRPHIVEQEKPNKFLDRSLSPGQVVLDSGKLHISHHGNQTASHSPSCTGIPRLFSAVKEIQNPFVNRHVCGGVSTALNYSSLFVDYFRDHTHEVAISSTGNPRASLQPSFGFALNKNASEIAPFSSQFASGNVSDPALSHQPLFELVGKLCSSPEWKQKAVGFGEKYRDEEFFGLPLNSQGELVRANSSGKGGFNQLKKLSLASGSSNRTKNLVLPRSMNDHSIMKGKNLIEKSALPNNQLSLFPAQNHMKENATSHSSAGLEATELQGYGKDGYRINSDRICNRSICLMDSDLNLTEDSFNGCAQYDQVQNRKEKGMTYAKENAENLLLNSPPPTMRLMGTDVTISQSSYERQEFADGKVWTDKKIIKDSHTESSTVQNSYFGIHFQQDWLSDPASRKFTETPVQRFEIESNHSFRSNLLMKPLESNFFQPALNWKANPEFHNSTLRIARDPNPNSDHFAHSPTSRTIFDYGADFREPFICSQLPAASTSRRNYQNINGNSVALKSKQNLLNTGKSAFKFPFLHPDHVEHVRSSRFQDSSKSSIPWSLQGRRSRQPFPEVGSRHQPHPARTSFLANCLVPHFPIASYDHNQITTHSHMESSVGRPSVAHFPLTPAVSGIQSTSSVNLGQRNRIKVKDRMKSKGIGIQDPDIGQKMRKRPEAREDYPMKLIKIPNIVIQDEPRAATQLTRKNFIDRIQCNTGSLDIEPDRNEASLVGWIPNESQCNGFGISAGTGSSQLDGVTRAGPIKLSPGVRHILKPSQNADQDNTRLIHSTLPFAPVADCICISETQKKSTKTS